MRLSRWFLTGSCALTFFVAATAKAEEQPPIHVTVWNNQTQWNDYNNAPPIPPSTPVAGETGLYGLRHNFDGEPMFGLYDDFVVKLTGNIRTDTTGDVRFYLPGDDGVILIIDGNTVIDDWYDKGGGGSFSEPVHFDADISRQFTVWFYENGGGAWFDSYWEVNGDLQQIPDSAFSVEPVVLTTTTSTTTLPTPPTETPTTTLPEVESTSTTDVVIPYVATTEQPSTTTIQLATTTSTTGPPETVVPDTSTSSMPPDLTVPLAAEKGGTTPPAANETISALDKVYKSRVHIGPISFTIEVTGAQKRTVTAIAVVQLATLGGLQLTQTAARRNK